MRGRRQFDGRRGEWHRAALACAQAVAVAPMVLGTVGCVWRVMVLGCVRPGHLVLRARSNRLSRRAWMPKRKPTAPEPRKQQGQEDGKWGKTGTWHRRRI